jgi:restriction endonuclease S subunit
VLSARDPVLPEFLYQMIRSDQAVEQMVSRMGKGSYPSINQQDVSEIQIALPPLPIQEALVAEVESYQRIIDGARQVVANWRPRIEVDPAWPVVALGEVCEVKGGKRVPRGKPFSEERTPFPYIRVSDFQDYSVDTSNLKYVSKEIRAEISRYTISASDVYISIAGTIGLLGTVPEELDGANLTENAAKLTVDQSRLLPRFLVFAGMSDYVQSQVQRLTHAVGVPKLALERIKTITIPLPETAVQEKLVADIECEWSLVEANRDLITRYERKIRERIGRVWGEGKS